MPTKKIIVKETSIDDLLSVSRNGNFPKTAPYSFIAWKKTRVGSHGGHCLVKLLIKKGALIRIHHSHNLDDRKCRADKAKVLSFHSLKGTKYTPKGEVFSSHDTSFIYKLNATVKPKYAFKKTTEVCASGIHFFLERDDASEYNC